MAKNYNKKELAEKLGISRPTLNTRLKSIGKGKVPVNKLNFDELYEMLAHGKVVETEEDKMFSQMYGLQNYSCKDSRKEQTVNNLITRYNFYEGRMRSLELYMKREEQRDPNATEEEIASAIYTLMEEHRKIMALQLRIVNTISDLLGFKLEEKANQPEVLKLEDLC